MTTMTNSTRAERRARNESLPPTVKANRAHRRAHIKRQAELRRLFDGADTHTPVGYGYVAEVAAGCYVAAVDGGLALIHHSGGNRYGYGMGRTSEQALAAAEHAAHYRYCLQR